jgi:cytochrome oxidase Cu insertion factor (SCO1/SenC/PrrC family)
MPATTLDCKGQTVAPGDSVRVLDITLDPDLDEDDLDMFMDMVGSVCEVERIDADGTGLGGGVVERLRWHADDPGRAGTAQMAKVAG